LKKIDPYLKQVLDNFTVNYFRNRENAFAGLDFEKLRSELAEIRDQALQKNQELISQFAEQAEKRGSKVILAGDSAEANQAVLEILKRHRVQKLVKSKSMVSEETRLNDFLLENGIEVRETDLGEWIIQLDCDHPTHMVLPAIHLNRKDVAEIFSEKLGREIPAEIKTLVRTAREELRKEIFEAGAGLTGANALIADSGAMMMITNEGNGRLVSTMPAVHIVFASMEKIYPSLREVLALLRMLPKNATGQIITSYVSFIAGPHNSAQYIILVDNHRAEMMTDPVFREVLRCIKCSACLNICPVYRLLGGKQFAHIYMGGIGTLLTAWINGLQPSRELASLCLNCRRCDEICAVKIRISDLIVALREKLNRELGKPFLKELIFDEIIANPGTQEKIFSLARTARPLIKTKNNFARKLPWPLSKYTGFRSLPAPAEAPLKEGFKSLRVEKFKSGKGNLKIFAGCLIEHFYPEIGISAAQVLARLGYQVDLVQAGCCGFPAKNAGFPEAGDKALAAALEKIQPEDTVITLCPTCTTMLEQGENKRGHSVSNFSKFIFEKELEKIQELIKGKKLKAKVSYHESCHQKHFLQAGEASRELLKLIAGDNFIELPNADSCCGFAGSFSMDHPELSQALLSEKLSSISQSHADLLILDCPGCLMQIRGGCQAQGNSVRVRHLAQILSEVIFAPLP